MRSYLLSISVHKQCSQSLQTKNSYKIISWSLHRIQYIRVSSEKATKTSYLGASTQTPRANETPFSSSRGREDPRGGLAWSKNPGDKLQWESSRWYIGSSGRQVETLGRAQKRSLLCAALARRSRAARLPYFRGQCLGPWPPRSAHTFFPPRLFRTPRRKPREIRKHSRPAAARCSQSRLARAPPAAASRGTYRKELHRELRVFAAAGREFCRLPAFFRGRLLR